MKEALPQDIVIFGATGTIGAYIAEEIYNAKESFGKIGIFTSEGTVKNKAEKIQEWKSRGVEIIVGDVNSEEDIAKALEGYDTVISCLGRTALLSQLPLLKVAEGTPNITWFYPSEYGTDIEYRPASAGEKPHQHKIKVRDFIRDRLLRLQITYLVTGPYSDMFFEPTPDDPRMGSWDVKARKATLLGTGDEKVSYTTMRDVGRLLVAALKTPTTEKERVLKVNSFTASGKEALQEFEKQTGEKWSVDYTPLEELKVLEKEAWANDWPTKTRYTLRRIWTEGGTLYEQRSNKEIGFEGEDTLENQVKTIIAESA